MITKVDAQLSEYDAKVGNSLQMIWCDPQGRIPVRDLQKALAVIKHKPDESVGYAVIQKLDVDKDGFVELEHVLGLVREEGLGTVSSVLSISLGSICTVHFRYCNRRRSAGSNRGGQGTESLQAQERGHRSGVNI